MNAMSDPVNDEFFTVKAKYLNLKKQRRAAMVDGLCMRVLNWFTRMGAASTNAAASVSTPVEKLCANIERKKTDPKGYEAEARFKDVTRLLNKLESVKTKRPLTDKEVAIAMTLNNALVVIERNGAGSFNKSLFEDVTKRVQALLPAKESDIFAQIDDANSMEEIMKIMVNLADTHQQAQSA